MDAQQLFPSEALPYAPEFYLTKRNPSTRILYVSTLIFFVGSILILPFVSAEISVRSNGILRASSEITEVKLAMDAIVKSVYIKDNFEVEKDQLMYIFQSPLLDERVSFWKSRIGELASFEHDLRILVKEIEANVAVPNIPLSGLYRQSAHDYANQHEIRESRLRRARQTYERNFILFKEGVIAATEFENYEYEMRQAELEVNMLRESHLTQWQQDLRSISKELQDSKVKLKETLAELKGLEVRAPISGTIQNFIGLYAGSRVSAGQIICEVNPTAYLVAEIYVSPSDVGLITKGMPVRIQIHAFNYNQWGVLKGQVNDISNDVLIIKDQTTFKVSCSLEKEFLELQNGAKGNLKKGMTLQARFVVTRRSLWQLLHDQVDDWINPNVGLST